MPNKMMMKGILAIGLAMLMGIGIYAQDSLAIRYANTITVDYLIKV